MLDKHIKISGITYCRACGFVGLSDTYKRYRESHFPTLTEEEFYALVEEDYFGLEELIINSTDYVKIECPRCRSYMVYKKIYDIEVEDDADASEYIRNLIREADENYEEE